MIGGEVALEWGEGELTNQHPVREMAQAMAREMVEGTKLYLRN